jgi:hypothetical protein
MASLRLCTVSAGIPDALAWAQAAQLISNNFDRWHCLGPASSRWVSPMRLNAPIDHIIISTDCTGWPSIVPMGAPDALVSAHPIPNCFY